MLRARSTWGRVWADIDLTISPNESGHGFPLFSPDSNTLHVMNELSDDMVTFDMRTMRQVGARTPIGGAVFGG